MTLLDKRLLIVDDDANWAVFFKEALSKQGYRFVEVQYGIDKFTDLLGYDLVILDIRMPRFNGFEAKEYLKTNSADTKIILMSQFEDFGLELLDKVKGAHGWLKKKTLEENECELLMLVNNVLSEKDSPGITSISNSQKIIKISINVQNGLNIRTTEQQIAEELYSELCKIIKRKDREYGKNHYATIEHIGEELTKPNKDKSIISTALSKLNEAVGPVYNIASHINKIIDMISKSGGF